MLSRCLQHHRQAPLHPPLRIRPLLFSLLLLPPSTPKPERESSRRLPRLPVPELLLSCLLRHPQTVPPQNPSNSRPSGFLAKTINSAQIIFKTSSSPPLLRPAVDLPYRPRHRLRLQRCKQQASRSLPPVQRRAVRRSRQDARAAHESLGHNISQCICQRLGGTVCCRLRSQIPDHLYLLLLNVFTPSPEAGHPRHGRHAQHPAQSQHRQLLLRHQRSLINTFRHGHCQRQSRRHLPSRFPRQLC